MFFKKSITKIAAPTAGILNLAGEKSRDFVDGDAAFLKSLFGDVRDLKSPATQSDILFIYAEVTSEGRLLGSSQSLREIIRDSGAKIVVVAYPNPSAHYMKANRNEPFGRANLVMTLDRRHGSFVKFFTALFSKMKTGVSMPQAWVELAPQVRGQAQPDRPDTIFACEIGPVSFK